VITSKKHFSANWAFAIASVISVSSLSAASLPADILPQLNAYNETWTSPSTNGSPGSMPIGNGDITANAWVENGGDLVMYIGKSDSWSEGTRLLKIARERIQFSPNPFSVGAPFTQTLDLYHGRIDITAGLPGSQISIRVWIDANQPVIRLEAAGDHSFSMICSNEVWRSAPYTPTSSDPASSSWRGVNTGWTESADTVLSPPDRLVSYHRNATSLFQTILAGENLSGFWTNYADPYLNRIFGVTIKAPGFGKLNNYSLQSSSGTNCTVSIYAYTAQAATIDWQNQMNSLVAQVDATDIEAARGNHNDWWDAFWNRSWIFISGDSDATNVTRGYILQRFMEACEGRGKHPIKFNGGTFTFDYNGQNGDYRTWGPGYWQQNTRLLYWPLLASGDFDLMIPWFNAFTNMMPLQMAATAKYYGHNGAFFPETFNFFGLHELTDWGSDPNATNTSNQYIRYHYQGGLETLAMMLDYYDYTQDSAFATNYIVPFATQVIRFFDQHWPRVNGKIKFYPANAIEMYWDCTNSTDYISGLMSDIPRLVALPTNFTSAGLIQEWTNCLASLPPLAMDATGAYVKPAQTYGATHNAENPECYCIFPYRLFGIGKSNNLALATFTNRVIQNNKNCWSQDVIEEALVGLTGSAQADVISNFNQKDSQCRFPAFWKSHNDYLPDLDNGGAAMIGLQFMLMQCSGNEIRLLPSWPATWDVDFKLCGPSNTVVRAKYQNGAVTQLDVTPVFRTNGIVPPPSPTVPPAAPTGLLGTPGDRQIALAWTTSTGASSYNVKRSLANNGPYSTIATNVRSTSFTDTGLANGTTYYYVVSAVNSLGASANSGQASAVPTAVVISASSENPPNETAAKAFDGLTSTKWFNANGGNTGWLAYYFGGPAKIVIRYDITSANDAPGRDPKNWQFQGSQDGINWTTLDTRTGETFPSRFLTRPYTITNSTAYSRYRLNITANNGDSSGLQLAELAFTYGVSGGPVRLGFAWTNGKVQLNWPADHIGWRLETQTNNNTAGLGTNWVTASGSTATNFFIIPIANVSSFFRLAYP
jgi:alpha-L-fucosidase 2